MVRQLAIAAFVMAMAVALWTNPGEVIPFTPQVILWCVVAFFGIMTLLAVPGLISATPDAITRLRYRSRFRADIRTARQIASAHAKRLAADPASDYIGDLHSNPWHQVQSDFIASEIAPKLGTPARVELEDWKSPLSQIIRRIVDDKVVTART